MDHYPSLTEDVLKALGANHDKVEAIEKEHLDHLDAIAVPHRRQLAVLMRERQKELDKWDGVWGTAIAAKDSPFEEQLQQIDTKILRAIDTVRMDFNDQTNNTRLTIKFKPNPFLETLEVYREMSRDRKTTGLGAIKWKVSDKMKENSIFALFEEKTADEVVLDLFAGWEEIYLNPLVFVAQEN
jgi:hypothetical protein